MDKEIPPFLPPPLSQSLYCFIYLSIHPFIHLYIQHPPPPPPPRAHSRYRFRSLALLLVSPAPPGPPFRKQTLLHLDIIYLLCPCFYLRLNHGFLRGVGTCWRPVRWPSRYRVSADTDACVCARTAHQQRRNRFQGCIGCMTDHLNV